MTTVFSFGTVKGILTYMGQSIAPNTLDWVSGTFLAVVLYWIGLFEERDSNKWRWFFQVDLSHAIGYYAKRVFGGVMWPLIFLGKALRNFVRRMWLFLQVDYALAISYFAKRVAAGPLLPACPTTGSWCRTFGLLRCRFLCVACQNQTSSSTGLGLGVGVGACDEICA
ncbi:hypothetical protein EI94DRAFT_890234 [Lactarius quietus]|nr:hypothetical protein EI94DRAFT_890234 [Lactarius quietus]